MEILAPRAKRVSSLGQHSATSAKATSIFHRTSASTVARTATDAQRGLTSAWSAPTIWR